MKDIEWLRNEINELPIMFAGFSVLKQREEFAIIKDDVLELIDQLDKPEDKKIMELEYELLLEKTKASKNSFYWFTAKKIPFFSTDVSYMSKDNHFYGFKQTPNYHYIEHHDLRFITHATLDELIEQFR